MGRVKGAKQKRRPKIKDSKQSERFKEAARELGADVESDAFERVLKEMTRTKGKGSKDS
jgi:hypothetical protein